MAGDLTQEQMVRAVNVAAYNKFVAAVNVLIEGVHARLTSDADEVDAASLAAVALVKSLMHRQQLVGMVAVLVSQHACNTAQEEPYMRLWPFSRTPQPEPEPEAEAGPSEVDVLREEASALLDRIAAADVAVTRLLASLRMHHHPTAGVDLSECLDAALDVRNALRPAQPMPDQPTSLAVTTE